MTIYISDETIGNYRQMKLLLLHKRSLQSTVKFVIISLVFYLKNLLQMGERKARFEKEINNFKKWVLQDKGGQDYEENEG